MKDTKYSICLIGYGILTILGAIFLCLAIFTEDSNNIYFFIALGSIFGANVFNLIRDLDNKKKK